MRTFTLIIFLFIYNNNFGQKFFDQIRVGEKMPNEINVGGFTEQNSDNCDCKTFSIDYGYNINNPTTIKLLQKEKGTKLGSVISLHYNSENIVTGKITIDMYYDEEFVSSIFNKDYNYDLKAIEQFRDFEFIEKDFETDLHYYSYFMKNYEVDGLNVIRTKGVIKNYRIDETYIQNSSYEPRYKLKTISDEINNAEPIQISESYGDLDKDGIDEKVVVIDTGA